MVTGRVFFTWEQEGSDPRDQHLALEGFDRQRRQGNFSDTVRSLGVGYPEASKMKKRNDNVSRLAYKKP